MLMWLVLFLVGVLAGAAAVASNPSPYFAALALVLVSGMGCGAVVIAGHSFLSLVLFLIFLGGMLVVFSYTSALATEPYPEAWLTPRVLSRYLVYLVAVLVGVGGFWEGWFGEVGVGVGQAPELSAFRGDLAGVALMYSSGGWVLVAGAWVLLLTLFVVLEVVRGTSRGALRAV